MISKALKSGLARPKTVVVYNFGCNPVLGAGCCCYIAVNPQQTWEFVDYGVYVEVHREKLHITMSIHKGDFERSWIIKEEN